MDRILLVKAGTGALLALASVILAVWPAVYRLTRMEFSWVSFTIVFASRMSCFLGAYIILQEPAQSDLICYYGWTKSLIEGASLYANEPAGVPTCYAPVFHYILAIPLTIVDHHATVVFTAIVFELAAFPVWLAVARRLFGEDDARRAASLYVLNPLPIWCVALYGQNQSWVALLLGLSVWFLMARKEITSGAMLGLATSAVKFLPLMYAPALFLASSRPVRWTLGFVAVNAMVYGGFLAAGVDVGYAARIISAEISSGNLPFVLTALGYDGLEPGFQKIVSVGGVGILAGLCLVLLVKRAMARRRAMHELGPGSPVDVENARVAVFLMTMLQMAFMLVSKKSHTTYLVMAFMPVCMTVALSRHRVYALVFFAVFCAVGTVEQSMWFRAMRQYDLSVFWQPEFPEAFGLAHIAIFLGMQLVVIGFFVWALAQAWRLAFPKPAGRSWSTGA